MIDSIIGIALVINSILDIKKRKISLVSCLFVFGLILLNKIIFSKVDIYDLMGLFVGIVVIAISIMSSGAIGIGDGIVISVLGIGKGLRFTILTLIVALFSSSFVSMFLFISGKCKGRDKIPFVPFLLIGFTLCSLYILSF